MTSLLVFAGCIGMAQGEELPSASNLERRAITARSGIRSIHLTLYINTEWFDRAGNFEKRVAKQMEIWQDSVHHRTDMTEEGKVEQGSVMGKRQVFCRNCERPDHYVFYVDQVTSIVLQRADDKMKPADRMGLTFDPRLLGYATATHINLSTNKPPYTLETEISSPAFTEHRVSEGDIGDDRAFVLRSTYKATGADHAVWVLPDKGYSVGLIEGSITTKDGNRHSRNHRSELALDVPSGIWFPRKCVLEQRVNDKVVKRETVEAEVRAINRPIPPSVFTLAGMSIPNGTTAFTPESPTVLKSMLRDGKLLPREKGPIPAAQPPVPAPRPVDPSSLSGGYRLWYAAATVLFSASAVVLLRRALARRPA